MNNKPTTVFTHSDLDGVVSYLVMCWWHGCKLDYVATTPMKLEQDYDKWASSKKPCEHLYFLDLDVTKIGEKIDKDTTTIFDHHKTNLYPFKNASATIYNETSCAKLVYDRLFREDGNKKLTPAQKTLIALADDWDSHAKTTPMSECLNIVYHGMSNKFVSFVQDYYNGFKQFDKFKQNTILLYKKHRSEYLNNLKPFIGEVEFEGVKAKVGAVFCNKFVQECCDDLFTKHNVDVSIAVLLEQKRIAVRRHPNNDKIDVSKFVQRIASGGGHESAAGGNLTEEFVEFTRMLKPL